MKQLQKQGARVYALVQKVGDEAKCIALLFQLHQACIRPFLSLHKQMKMRSCKIALLGNSLEIRPDVTHSNPTDEFTDGCTSCDGFDHKSREQKSLAKTD